MKKLAGLLAALALLLQVGGALAQVSDYDLIQSFKQRDAALLGSIKAAQDPGQTAALENEVNRLQSEFAQHRALLAQGLYPATLESAIATLREQLKRSNDRIALAEESKKDKETIGHMSDKIATDAKTIAVISEQNAQYLASLEKLTQEAKEMGAQIQKLTEENTGLVAQIKALQLESKKDKESIAKLKALTEKLNANLRDRDALVLKMMDSLFTEYSKAGLTDEQRKDLFVNAQGNDYVGKILSTIEGNVKYSESALFSAQDLKLIREEQRKLSGKWDEIKPFVAKLYEDEQAKTRDITTVDSRVADWKKSIEETTWKSIHQVFAGQNIDIGPFANAGEFHARMLAYVDGQLQNPSRGTYQAFKQKVWDSPIKDQWLPLIPTDELTAQQRAEIEERITQWDKKISAIFLRWVLIGLFAVVLVAVLALVLRRKKTP